MIGMVSFSEILKPLDASSHQPLYQQLQRALREAIQNHVLAPDDPKWVHRDDDLAPPTQAWVHRAHYVGPAGKRLGGLRKL